MQETGRQPDEDEPSRSTNKPDQSSASASDEPGAGESEPGPRDEGSSQKNRRDKGFSTRSREGKSCSPSGSQKRVSVTPNDWRKLEALSEELGLPYSKVYNMSFQALLEKLGHKGHAG